MFGYMKKLALGFSLAFGVALSAGTFVACDKADDALDCNEICDKYKECLGGNSYDESACRTRCRDKADDTDFDKQVDKCAACVSDDKSCTQNVFMCTDDCVGVVP